MQSLSYPRPSGRVDGLIEACLTKGAVCVVMLPVFGSVPNDANSMVFGFHIQRAYNLTKK